MIGRSISHYRILSELGAGGMGVVYLAEDERLGRQIAVKFLPKESTSDRNALERFRVEARAASSLSHPGICAIYDIGTDGDSPFIVMELLKGETLRDRLARGPLKVPEVLDIGMQLADALAAAHAHGIIHRDIKPANIFLIDKTRVKILDFGLAKLASGELLEGSHTTEATTPGRRPLENQITVPGSAVGTVCYMSPEQARGEEIDARTDLFSLGVVLYEMATGRQAFGGSTTAVAFDAILNRTPPAITRLNPQIPERLWPVIATLIEKEPDLRFQHATELLAELKRVRRDLESGPVGASRATRSAAHVMTAAPQASSADSAAPAARADRGPWPALAGGFAVLAVIGLGYGAWMWATAPKLEVNSSVQAIPSAVPLPAAPAANPPSAPEPATVAPPATPPAVTSGPATERRPRETPPPNRAPSPPPQKAAEAPRPAPTVAAAPTTTTVPAQPAPTPPAPAPPPVATLPAAPAPVVTPVEPPPAPPAPAVRPPAETVKLPAASPSEESAIREVIASYERAIETKNIALFRSVRPGLSAAEESRLRESFRQVVSQEVNIRILDLKISGASATVRLSRVDTIVSAGRRQTQNSQQTLQLNKTASGWVITEIGA